MNPLRTHSRPALQFSGGKDSLAIATLLRPWRDQITVYWAKVPEQFPETLASLDWLKSIYPSVVEVPCTIAGLASDIVPEEATPFGRMVSGSALPPIIGRYECCYRTLMLPMEQRMREDGIDLIIRGQRNTDERKPPTRDGDVVDGVTYWFPLQSWTEQQVFTYLRRKGTPIPSFYDAGLKGGLDCPGCSAWWPERRMRWLRQHHPIVAVATFNKLEYIRSQLQPAVDDLARELQDGQ